MEQEYNRFDYFLSAFYAQRRHCIGYCDEFCRFSFLLEGNFSVSFLDSVSCHPLMSNLSLLSLGVTPSIFLALIADNSQICSPSKELFPKLQMLPGISNSAHTKLNDFTFHLSFWDKKITVGKFLRQI